MDRGQRIGVRAQRVALGKLLGCAALALAVLASTGCAIKQDGRNRTLIGLDTAAILGTEHARFTLTDGTEGSLRSQGDVYSLKIEKFHKVVALGNARQMRLDQSFQIDGRTVLVIHLENTSGCVKTQVLSIRESQVLQWMITPSDCRSMPALAAHNGQLVLSYTGSRFVYDDARLVEEKPVAQAAPAREAPANTTPTPAPTPRSTTTPRRTARPAPAQDEPRSARTTSAKAPAPTKTPAPAASAAAQRPATAAPAPAPTSVPPLVFSRSTQEQKPTVITLE